MAVAYPVGRLLWSFPGSLSGAGTTHSGPIDIHDVANLWLAVAVTGSVAGTTPTLTVQLDLYDNAPTPNLFPAFVALTALTGAGSASASVGLYANGANQVVLPMACQVTYMLGGTTPVFNGATISLFGR